ncbi:MAG: hypothetical protein ABL998_00625, partial [Planctomycetota bacterium]
FDRCFPEAEELEEASLIGQGGDQRDEEDGEPPPPLFFRWAGIAAAGKSAELRVGLGGGEEPQDWHISAGDGKYRLKAAEHASAGSPDLWTFDVREESPAPLLLDLHRLSNGTWRLGHLPVNALDDVSRTRPDLWRDIDLETLLDVLASGGHVHRKLGRLLRQRQPGKSGTKAPELDPHKRVDSSGFLMPRIRRISRALEGLRERLSTRVLSEAALEWRFQGPLSPGYLARRLVEHAPSDEDRGFLVAEIALVVADAGRRVSSAGVPLERVKERYQSVVSELRALVPLASERSSMRRYVNKAFSLTKPS